MRYHPQVEWLAIGFLLSAAMAHGQEPQYEWVNVTRNAAFAPRDGAGALVFKNRMWLLGGWNPGDKANFPRICNNEVWSSMDGAKWNLDKANTFRDRNFDARGDWEGRHTAGYVVFKDKMWIVGGDVNQGHYHNDVWNSPDGKAWTLVTDKVPWGPRALHYTVAHDSKIWVMGGQTLPSFAKADDVVYSDIWNSDDGMRWTKVEPKEPYWSPRGVICGSAVFKGRMWVLGGGIYVTSKRDWGFHNDVWSSADGVHWTRHTQAAPWKPRIYHIVTVFDDRLWVLQGRIKGPADVNDVWHSADGVNWSQVPKSPWAGRHASSVFVHDGALWLVAGNNMERDVWKLQKSSANAADARAFVAQAVKAAGGQDKLPRMLRWKETWFLGNSATPNPREAILEFPSKWYQGGKNIAAGDPERAEKTYLVWVWTLAPLVDKNSTLKPLPDSKLGDRRIRGLRLTRDRQKPIDVYFDAETKKLARIDWRAYQIDFADWKESGGFRYPAKAFVRRKDGSLYLRNEFQVLEVLKELPKNLTK
ncbi:MAG: hypothetical protein FJ271_22665 [Planctomycetes bacterium]|nr:hypothetical protein [Planctomycetota bacterium]